MSNKFIKQTIKGLEGIKIDDPLIASRTFDIDKTKNKEDCILIMGLNPAGYEDDAKREKNYERTYFYSLNCSGKKSGEKWFHNQYFRPIFDFVNYTVNSDAKWPWVNKDIEDVRKEIEVYDDLLCYKNAIKEDYENQKKRQYTIYIGDMFYYHGTKSKKLDATLKVDTER